MEEISGWAVVISKPSNEELAAKSILAEGYRSYLPRYRKQLTRRMDPLTGRMISTRHGGEVVFRPLFTGYLFAELHPNQQWRPIIEAKGVQGILKRGDRPALLGGEIIELVREAEQTGEFDEVRPKEKRRDIKPGNVVRIEAGAYQGFLATIAGMDDAGRVHALVSMFGRQSKASFEPNIPLKVVVGY